MGNEWRGSQQRFLLSVLTFFLCQIFSYSRPIQNSVWVLISDSESQFWVGCLIFETFFFKGSKVMPNPDFSRKDLYKLAVCPR